MFFRPENPKNQINYEKKLFGFQYADRHNALLQRNAAMLVGVLIIVHVMIVVLRIRQKHIVFGKNVFAAQVSFW